MKLIIMRGVSGSGKSTKARELVDEFLNQNPNDTAIICSADDFFINNKTGKYEFDAKKIGQAHSWCRGQAHAAMKLKAGLVLIDNTSTQKWEFKPYEDLAFLFEYETEECVVGNLDNDSILLYAERNAHGVPLEIIERQAKRFET